MYGLSMGPIVLYFDPA